MNTTTSAPWKQYDICKVEECAYQVVNLMQRCTEIIRSIPEFAPLQKKNLLLSNVMLYTEMKQKGIVENIFEIQELVESTIIPDTRQATLQSTEPTLLCERSQMVHQILLPLVSSLSRCYAVLDQVPAPKPTKGRKPPPPRGMLSIQNYTDIAAILEILVCSSILPNLQSFVLTSVEDRARYRLPKSLAGRIPPRSLLWGSEIQKSNSVCNEDLIQVVYELQATAQALGKIVLLDRFRPMLLPRHLVDVYAAMLQAEAFELQSRKNSDSKVVQGATAYRELQHAIFGGDSTSGNIPLAVDAYSHARACQALLFQGTKAPLWLRQRVSLLLTNLACRDLPAIVQVFVQEGMGSTQDMIAASMRLAGALTGPSLVTAADTTRTPPNYHAQLCRQLVRLLDVPVVTEDGGTRVDPSHEAGILTVWAVLNQFPSSVVLEHVLPLLGDGLVPDCSDSDAEVGPSKQADPMLFSVHTTVRRIVALLSHLPLAGTQSKIFRLFLQPIHAPKHAPDTQEGFKMTLLGQLLRVASVRSTVYSRVKEDAVLSLRLLVETMCQSSFKPIESTDPVEVQGTDLVATALVYSIAPNVWDLAGSEYHIVPSSSEAGLDQVGVKFATDDTQDIHAVTQKVAERSRSVVQDLIVPLSRTSDSMESNSKTGAATEEPMGLALPSRLFNLLLLVYLSTTSTRPGNPSFNNMSPGISPLLPTVFWKNRSGTAIGAMTLLPLLCENCSPQSLLLPGSAGKKNTGYEILDMIKLVLDCSSYSFIGDKALELGSSNGIPSDGKPQHPTNRELHPFLHFGIVFGELLGLREGECGNANRDDNNSEFLAGNDTLLSISSLVLSMLVALLELGCARRTQEEETILNSMLPPLKSLASFTELDFSTLNSEESMAAASADLAEMASHAMALIASRSVPPQPTASKASSRESSREINMENTLRQAEKDLQSEQPPIRARGVVALRHLARGYLVLNEGSTQTELRDPPLIEVIGEGTSQEVSAKDDHAVGDILRLSILSLADSESYVYLAGVQTVVAASDVCPRKVVPALGRAVCLGVASFSPSLSSKQNEEMKLTKSQRVKLAEALMFTIRRRGPAVYEFLEVLMDQMVFGIKGREASLASEMSTDTKDLQPLFQRETNKYFVNGNDTSEKLSDPEIEREERHVRVCTGGPVFDSEEGDLVRAACISVVAELVSVSQPHVLAKYSPHLVRVATNALQLDGSRPVRRSAALLCREIYDAILREHNESMESVQKTANVGVGSSLVIAVVSSGEEEMFSALQRCVEGVDITREGAKRSIHCYDPAAVSRCKEALDSRMSAQREGLLSAATLIVNSTKQEENDPVTRIVRSRLDDSSDPRDAHMRTLHVDPMSLKLE